MVRGRGWAMILIQRGQAKGDVVLEVLDFRNADAGGGNDFIQRHGRAHFGGDAGHFDAEFVASR